MSESQKLIEEISELRKIVGTLPLTRDGFRVTPGMELFIVSDGSVQSLGTCDPAENNTVTDSEFIEFEDTHLNCFAVRENAVKTLDEED